MWPHPFIMCHQPQLSPSKYSPKSTARGPKGAWSSRKWSPQSPTTQRSQGKMLGWTQGKRVRFRPRAVEMVPTCPQEGWMHAWENRCTDNLKFLEAHCLVNTWPFCLHYVQIYFHRHHSIWCPLKSTGSFQISNILLRNYLLLVLPLWGREVVFFDVLGILSSNKRYEGWKRTSGLRVLFQNLGTKNLNTPPGVQNSVRQILPNSAIRHKELQDLESKRMNGRQDRKWEEEDREM